MSGARNGELIRRGGAPVGVYQDWAPVLSATVTPPTLGTGSVQEGRVCQIGSFVSFRAKIRFGGSPAAGDGTYILVPPVTARKPSTTPSTAGWMVGRFVYFDVATFTNYGGGIFGDFNGASGDIFNMAFDPADGRAFGDGLLVADDFPFTPTAGCEFGLWGFYEAA